MRCPVCSGTRVEVFLEIDALPVLTNMLCSDGDEARTADAGRIALAVCGGCGYVFNAAFEPERVRYTATYENSQHFSPRFRAYARDLAASLGRRHGLRGKDVVEIGCGRGDFLVDLCEICGSRGWGFDPAFDGSRELPEGVRIEARWFADVSVAPDLLCCRHCLEHVDEPVGFLQSVGRTAKPNGKPVGAFFEVPNGLYMLREMAVWDVIYEHCGYYVPQALEQAFARAGYGVEAVEETFEGQFLTVHARIGEGERVPQADVTDVVALARAFGEKHRAIVNDWRARVAQWQRPVVWGAGSKGTSFVNLVPGVAALVDVNPRKQGHYVPGTGHPIIRPQDLPRLGPDAVIVMNPIYRDEIREGLQALGLAVDMACA